MNPLFSIVVPVYNAGTLLNACVESVLSQSSGNWELLLIDDGSKDDSLRRCKEYAANDARIRVLHQPNQGLAVTRNRGIDEAIGKYIIFLDNDDTLESTAIEYLTSLVASLTDVNVFVFKLILNDNQASRVEAGACFKKSSESPLDGVSAFRILFSNPITRGCYWQSFRYVFKRQYYIEKKFRYFSGLNYEDIEANPRFILESENVSLVDYAYYRYLQRRPGSISTGYTLSGISNMMVVWDRWYDYFSLHSVPNDIEVGFKAVLARIMWDCLIALGAFHSPEKERFLNLFHVRKRRLLMVDQPRLSALSKRFLLCVCGLRFSMNLLWKFRR